MMKKKNLPCTLDFIFGKIVGEGSFGTVYLAKDVRTNKKCAIKVYEKSHIIKERKIENVNRERELLIAVSSINQYFVKLLYTFQDPKRLFIVLSYAPNGDLHRYIKILKNFNLELTRFYAAQIVRSLEYLHRFLIVHQDLKPSNILLNEKMHIQITDFGSARCLNSPTLINEDDNDEHYVYSMFVRRSRNTLDGTAPFLSPEQLREEEIKTSSDLWTLGCIIYYMATGFPPFNSRSEYGIFQQIVAADYEVPDHLDEGVKSVINQLLTLDSNKRLGSNDNLKHGYLSIRKHSLFEELNFDILHEQTPPFMEPFIPGTDAFKAIETDCDFSDNLKPGLDESQSLNLIMQWDC